ncbi:MAG: multiheme c-type cytochrome [Bacillota bacterium]|nr:multiheme c-type cytochrome [Bacillota bacterium]
MKMKRYLSAGLVLTALGLLWGTTAPALAAPKSSCISCHEKVTPAVVKQFAAGKMGRTLDCSACHGTEHRSEQDVAKAKLPSPDTCAQCHPKKVEEFRAGKHALAWAAMKAMPMLSHQPLPMKGDGLKGCSGCHTIGDKAASEITRYGSGACDSCHTRHTFSVQEARDPRTCRTCHMGFDHPQWEMWQTSKHGTIWEIETGRQTTAGSERAPTCQTCHLPGGNHAVMTAWGFLALRVPEDDPEWWKDRVTILQALGVLDGQGNPTERLAVVQGGKVARLSKEEFAQQRARMLETCTKCHSRRYAEENLAAGDQMVREADRIFAQAIRTVKSLYDQGLLKKPAGWTFAPDLLQFYEAKTPIEQDLYLIFMEYRMRTFQGAFHANPDYAHWYGWAKMKEAAVRIEDAAAALRAGQKR